MAFRLMKSAQAKWRKLDGANRLPEIVQAIAYKDGIKQLQAAAGSRRHPLSPYLLFHLATATVRRQRFWNQGLGAKLAGTWGADQS